MNIEVGVRSNHVPRHEAVKSRCRPINVPGTANVVCGYRLREPGKGAFYSNQVHRIGHSTNPRVGDDFDDSHDSTNFIINNGAEARREKHLFDTDNFIKRNKKRCQKNAVEARVKLGMVILNMCNFIRKGTNLSMWSCI